MRQVSVIGDERARPDDICRQLGGHFDVKLSSVDSIQDAAPGACIVLDVNLNDNAHLITLKDWLRRKPKDAKVVFITDKASHLQETRAYAIGGTDVIHRPVDASALLSKLRGALAPEPECGVAALADSGSVLHEPGAAAAIDALKGIFSSAFSGTEVDSTAIQSAGKAVVGQIEAQGLTGWVDTVRMHHSQTYQHCLLVTGIAVAFGQHIGASKIDRERLSFAGMLHDIGKARIPLAILEKPGRLDADEMAVMRQHPQHGFDALSTADLSPEMLDIVVHHHEYLDGSGYPHGLQAAEISDLVRIMTISDVFGALIERRSYKPPLSGTAAYQILLDMGAKLDADLVRAFKFSARLS